MKLRESSRLFCTFLFLILATNYLYAQDSFVISGPLDSYSGSEIGTGGPYTFDATVRYDSSLAADVTNVYAGSHEESYFDVSITDIEYSIFDSSNTAIINFAEIGGVTNYIRATNDLSGSSYDEIRYETVGVSRALIVLRDGLGMMVSDVLAIPATPELGDFDFSAVILQFNDAVTGENFSARGVVTEISSEASSGGEEESSDGESDDPYVQCAEQALNHGEYVSCVAHVTNILKANDEISGKEKGQAQSKAANNK